LKSWQFKELVVTQAEYDLLHKSDGQKEKQIDRHLHKGDGSRKGTK